MILYDVLDITNNSISKNKTAVTVAEELGVSPAYIRRASTEDTLVKKHYKIQQSGEINENIKSNNNYDYDLLTDWDKTRLKLRQACNLV